MPPVFSVTPKGSGAGYGVGFDLDDLLTQSLTDLQHSDLRERSVHGSVQNPKSYFLSFTSSYVNRPDMQQLEIVLFLELTGRFLFLYVISHNDSAPLSASLLSDWLEVHRMTPADLESLQQELQLGSPMILSDNSTLPET